jgi:hypothetical protein
LALRHASLRHSGVQLVICRELPDAGCLAAFCDQPILEKVTNWLRAARYAPFGQLYSAKALSGFARFNLGQWLALESYWGLTIHTSTCLFFAAKAVCGNWYCQFCSMDAIAAALTVSLNDAQAIWRSAADLRLLLCSDIAPPLTAKSYFRKVSVLSERGPGVIATFSTTLYGKAQVSGLAFMCCSQ